jgi:glycosyltransferase involved in cell wall biosynthesis
MLGLVDVKNPSAISRAEVESWVAQGYVIYVGATDDVRKELAGANCVVLPSYKEGTPRSLLEAAAMTRPIITTDTVGCSEVVDHGINGYLCKVREAEDLADKMNQMFLLSPDQRKEMGLSGRTKRNIMSKLLLVNICPLLKHSGN